MNERWAPVAGYETLYEVSDHGRVMSHDRIDAMGRLRVGRVLRQLAHWRGYRMVALHNQGRKTALVHRLVAAAFIGPCPTGQQVCHNDGNPLNNHLDNLRYGCPKENMADRERHGRTFHPQGEKHGLSKLSAGDIESIRSIRDRSQRAIAADYGICQQHVSLIVNGVRWRHLSQGT